MTTPARKAGSRRAPSCSAHRLVGRVYRCRTPKENHTNFLRVVAVGKRTIRTQHLLDDLTIPPPEPKRGRDSDFRRTYTMDEWRNVILKHWTPND